MESLSITLHQGFSLALLDRRPEADSDVREMLLQPVYPRLGHLSAAGVEILQVRQGVQVFKPGIADLGERELKTTEVLQRLEVFQPGVRDPRPVKVEVLELGQVLQVR